MKGTQTPAADPRLMKVYQQEYLVQATYDAITRIRLGNPELWARIEKRAAEIRREWEEDPSGAPPSGRVAECDA